MFPSPSHREKSLNFTHQLFFMSSLPALFDVYQQLFTYFGAQGWWPLYNPATKKIEYHPQKHDPPDQQQLFEMSVGAILTQNTTWKNAEKAVITLHNHHLLTPEAITTLSIEKLAAIIISSGYHRQKAKKLQAFAHYLASGTTITRDTLLEVWGIGPETADSILLYAYRQPVFVIDAYTQRIMERLGYAQRTYDELQELFLQSLPHDAKLFAEYHALLVALGKEFCKKINPLCEHCPIKTHCDYFLRKRSSADGES
jgi:endonuclease-3 related protein